MESNISVVPIQNQHAVAFHQCLDIVAREGKYLASTKAPPLEGVASFVADNVENDYAQFVALDGDKVVGWCDVIPLGKEALAHCGVLGMGVHPDYRRQGLGWRLMDACIKKSQRNGLKRIELEAWVTNVGAILMYQKYGFLVEGVKKNALCIHEKYVDLIVMGLWLDT